MFRTWADICPIAYLLSGVKPLGFFLVFIAWFPFAPSLAHGKTGVMSSVLVINVSLLVHFPQIFSVLFMSRVHQYSILNRAEEWLGFVFKGNLFSPNALLFHIFLTVVWCLPSEVEASQLFLGCPSWKVWMETLITAAQVRMAAQQPRFGEHPAAVLLCHRADIHLNRGEQVSTHARNQSCMNYADCTVRLLTCLCVITCSVTNLGYCIKCWLPYALCSPQMGAFSRYNVPGTVFSWFGTSSL